MKLHHYFFWLLIFFLPVQLGRHFWFEWTQVLGLPIDYLSPTLYLTDILVITILFFWGLEQRKKRKKDKIKNILQKYWLAMTIFLFLLVNSFLAANQNAAFYKLIKITEFTLLGLYIAKNNYKIAALVSPLSGAVIYSSLIAIGQFFKQGAIGGLFWWLGERTFNIITPGIAKAIIGGRLVLRPYATFPHPNVLAGFVLVSMILIGRRKKRGIINKLAKWLALISGGVTIILSFSRATWVVSSLTSVWLWVRRWKKWQGAFILIVFFFVAGLLYYQFALPFSSPETIDQRLSLARVAIEMVKTNPLAGVGLNNFIPQLPYYWQQFGLTYWLQPVHNLYLLVAAETGLMGLMIFLWFLILTYKKLLLTNHWLLITALSVILVLGLFDHYWLTLQQSQLLLTVVFGLSWRK